MKRILPVLFIIISSFFTSFSLSAEEDLYAPEIRRIESEEEIDLLKSEGVEILRRRDDLLLCLVPKEGRHAKIRSNNAESRERGYQEENGELKKRKMGKDIFRDIRRPMPVMDKAREFFKASYIHSGDHLPQPYTGKNVVAGICDIGLDPLHINFYDENGENRIKRIVQYKEATGERIELNSEEEYRDWVTDNVEKEHATHVAGIMAGSCFETGFQGMAPGADLVITTSQLSDVGLLCGAEDILDYAREQGKPAVINMSMANYLGPHDGTSLFSQYIDKIGEEAIVIMSAGNAGDYSGGLHHVFSAGQPSVRVNISNHAWTQFEMYGATQGWSLDASPLRVRLCIFDEDTKQNIFFFPYQELGSGRDFILSSDGNSQEDREFAKYFNGIFALTGGIDSENGRFFFTAEYDAKTETVCSRGPWARYLMTLEIEGEHGNELYLYSDNSYTRLTTNPGNPSPTSALSFSDLSSGHNLISVGMYVNRLMPEDDPSDSTPPGTVCKYSSYGVLPDGRVMPHTVGPGWNVISSRSLPHTEAFPDEAANSVESIFANGRENAYVMGGGTSMSAPYVAGAIACWLEANPELRIADIQKLIEKTNLTDVPTPSDPRNGKGFFNPYTGLQEVVRSYATTVEHPSADRTRLTVVDKTLTLWNPDRELKIIDVFTLDGKRVLSASTSGPLLEMDLSSLPADLYICRTQGASLKFNL